LKARTATLVGASLITVLANIGSRFFGFAREAVIANFFGTSAALEVFIIAFTLPELLTFIFFAAIPTAFIPAKKSHEESGHDESELFWSGTILFASIFALIALLLIAFRESIPIWIDPNLVPEQRELAARLILIFSGFIFFRGMEAYFRSWLYEKKRFVVPSLSSILVNAVVLGILFLWQNDITIELLAYSWLVGSFVIFVYNGAAAFLLIKPKAFTVYTAAIKPFLLATIAVGLVEAIALIYPVVDRILARWYLGDGQIAALRYAIFLAHIPTGIFAATISLAAFPWISDYSTPDGKEKLHLLYSHSVRLLFFIMSFIAVGMVIFSEEIVRVAFQRGAFDAQSLSLTSSPLFYYAIGIPLYSVYLFQMRLYYAGSLLKRLGFILLVMLVIKITLSLWLVHPMAQDGLALATTFAWLSGFLIMSFDLSRKLQLSMRELWRSSILKITLLLAIVAALWLWLDTLWPSLQGELSASATHSLLYTFIRLTIFGIIGIVVYLGLAYALKLEEPIKLLATLKKKTFNA